MVTKPNNMGKKFYTESFKEFLLGSEDKTLQFLSERLAGLPEEKMGKLEDYLESFVAKRGSRNKRKYSETTSSAAPHFEHNTYGLDRELLQCLTIQYALFETKTRPDTSIQKENTQKNNCTNDTKKKLKVNAAYLDSETKAYIDQHISAELDKLEADIKANVVSSMEARLSLLEEESSNEKRKSKSSEGRKTSMIPLIIATIGALYLFFCNKKQHDTATDQEGTLGENNQPWKRTRTSINKN